MSPKRPIRVLLWCPAGAGEHYNGAGSFFYRMFRHAPAGIYEVTLVHGAPKQAVHPLFKSQHYLSQNTIRSWDAFVFTSLGRRWVRKHAREFDIVLGSAAFHKTVLPCYEAHLQGVPVVTWIANQYLELRQTPGWKAWMGFAANRRRKLMEMPATIAMSQMIADELRGYHFPEAKIVRIPMAADTDTFCPVTDERRRELRSALGWRNLPTIIFCGGVNNRKRPALLLEAIGILRSGGIDVQLVLAGPLDNDPDYVARMRQRAAALKVEDLVVFAGFIRDPAPLYQASDYFGLPSSNEGMPASLVEAMACGLVPIVTEFSGARDLVNDGRRGRIISGDEHTIPGGIAAALRAYLADAARVHAESLTARKFVEETFSFKSVEKSYRALFDRLIDEASRQRGGR